MRYLAAFALACLIAPPVAGHEGHKHTKPLSPAAASASASKPEPTEAPVGELTLLGHHLRQPEYWHVMINPIPPLAMAAGSVLLLAALLHTAELAARGGLALIAFGGAAFLPTLLLGQKAYDRLFNGLAPDAQLWADVHMARAEKTQALFYLAGVVAIAALVQLHRRKASAKRLRLAALALALCCSAAAVWIAHAGGQISHPELREGPPSAHARSIVPSQER